MSRRKPTWKELQRMRMGLSNAKAEPQLGLAGIIARDRREAEEERARQAELARTPASEPQTDGTNPTD